MYELRNGWRRPMDRSLCASFVARWFVRQWHRMLLPFVHFPSYVTVAHHGFGHGTWFSPLGHVDGADQLIETLICVHVLLNCILTDLTHGFGPTHHVLMEPFFINFLHCTRFFIVFLGFGEKINEFNYRYSLSKLGMGENGRERERRERKGPRRPGGFY